MSSLTKGTKLIVRRADITTPLGAAVVPLIRDIILLDSTKALRIELGRVITTVPVDDPLTAVAITSLIITINGNQEVVNMDQADLANILVPLENRHVLTIANGIVIDKWFNPPLPPDTKVTVAITVNTLALATTTPAATANLNFRLYEVHTSKTPGDSIVLYQPINPVVVGAGGGPGEIDLGIEIRKLIGLMIVEEDPAGTPVDTTLDELVIEADAIPLARISHAESKSQYEFDTDIAAIPVGHHWFRLSEPYQVNNRNFLGIWNMKAAGAALSLRGYQIVRKPLNR